MDSVRNYLSRRRTAYIRVFKPTEELAPYAAEVLADLAKFCRANESCFHADPRAHAVAEGRREVWLRITKHLNLTDEQLWALHGVAPTSPERKHDD